MLDSLLQERMVSRCRIGGFLTSKLMKPSQFNSVQALSNASLHTSPRISGFASLVLGSRIWSRGQSEDVALSQRKRLFLPTAYCSETCPYTFYQDKSQDFCPLCDDALDEL